jgi:hypothetical protein
MPGVLWSVGMHDVFKIAPVVHREALNNTLSMEATFNNMKNVQFYSYTRDKA